MGEVEHATPGPRGFRRWIFNNIAPDLAAEIEAQTELLAAATINLARLDRQNTELLGTDQGKFRSEWDQLSDGDFNPEAVGLDEYKNMLDYDAQVIAGFELIQMGVLMKPWKIVHPDPEIVLVLTKAFQRLRYPNFRGAMKEMMNAIVYGNSVTEIVYDNFEAGGRSYWMPRRQNGLKTFDPASIKFFTDIYGNLEKIEQDLDGDKSSLPTDRTLVWSHDREFGNWYGKSILRGCYKNWYIKDAMMKFANIAYERFGAPILLGTVNNDNDAAAMLLKLKTLVSRAQGVITKQGSDDQTSVDVLESKKSEMPYLTYIRFQNEMILRRMLINEKVFEGGGGTYGPKTGLDLVLMRFSDFRLELLDILNTLIQMITDLNWSNVAYPVIEFEPLSVVDKVQLAQIIWTAIDKGVVDNSEAWIRQHLDIPPKEEGDAKEEDNDDE